MRLRPLEQKKQPWSMGSSKGVHEEEAPLVDRLGATDEAGGQADSAVGGDRAVFLSSATLLVVPSTLIQHWETQVRALPSHVSMKVLLYSFMRSC